MSDEHQTSSPPRSAAAPLGHSVIPIVQRLQYIAAQLERNPEFDLPQICVVGAQSSGKSSLLEALVGRDFLPRGSDICILRPLVLELVQIQRNFDGTEEEWGEFLHLPGKKLYDFSQIRKEIEDETNRETGPNRGVSDKQIQIRLKIFSPNVLDMTLVRLPGIMKVGDQPSDIELRIGLMITSYIRESCLILAVTPANSDIANSDALQMARIADPDGHRTIGVITKLDIMDRETNAHDFLIGKVIPLKLGYVGVVNRRADILLNMSIKEALVAEENFFRSCPVYNDLADRCGTPQLAKKLNQILVQHIKSVLPNLKSQISAQLFAVSKEHSSYGDTTEWKTLLHPSFPRLKLRTIDKLGESNFPVYKVVNTRKDKIYTESEYVVKYVKLEGGNITKEMARELCIMLEVKHDHVMGLVRASPHDDGLCFVMKLMRMDLHKFLEEPTSDYTPDRIKIWMRQILEGICYLHTQGVIHRDLKPENIFLTEDNNLKIADFGLSRFIGDQLSPQVTTIQYRAPEILLGLDTYTQAVDMWSIGCIFYDMKAGHSLFVGGNVDDMINDIFSMFGCPTDITWPGVTTLPIYPKDLSMYSYDVTYDEIAYWFDEVDAVDFMKGLLCMDPAKRMTARQALDHPFMLIP